MVLILPTLVLAAVVAASPHGPPHRRHAGVNTPHIELDPETARNGTLVKRGQTFTGARLSMYYPETGNQVACGGFYQNNDFVRVIYIFTTAKACTDGAACIDRRAELWGGSFQ